MQMINFVVERTKVFAVVAVFLFLGAPILWAQEDRVDFNRDIRPILSDTCFKCHGPDEATREADLRLDTQDGLLESDMIEPGDAENSHLLERILTDDASELMPPPNSGRKLTEKQKQLIKKWIEQGAKFSQHWSFESIRKPEVPKVAETWSKNPIDAFVYRRMKDSDLSPAEEADRATLCRRLYLDLTGLLPTPKELEQFLQDKSPNAYEKLVDRLLASQHYGEHMARYWLDYARYGDTHGLHLDNYREMWLYRDWVVNSFNRNQSFRQFGIEQLAGDLLKSPSENQLIATGFNRAHVTTGEGGSIKEEVYVRNVIDRVSTMGTVFMGLTVGCAQCHDHKFDPISQKEFYQLFAYFNSLEADPMDANRKDHPPNLRVADEKQKKEIQSFEESLTKQRAELAQFLAEFEYAEPANADVIKDFDEPRDFVWIEDDAPMGASKQGNWRFTKGNEPKFSGANANFEEAAAFTQHFFINAPQPLEVGPGDRLFTYVFIDPKKLPKEIMLQFNDGTWEHRVYWGENLIDWGNNNSPSRLHKGKLPEAGKWVRLEVAAEEVGFTKPAKIHGWAFSQFGGKVYWDRAGVKSKRNQSFEFRSLNQWAQFASDGKIAGVPKDIQVLAKKALDKRSEPEQKRLREYFLSNVFPGSKAEVQKRNQSITQTQNQLNQFRQKLPTTLIYKERKQPKPAFYLKRGQYDAKGEQVQRATPEALPGFSKEWPNNRLGLAYWLFSKKHPLTSRVTVNRFWQQIFGTGIVKTSEDLGSQGEWPSHPELLDFLSADFMENDWDVKRLMRMIVTSKTYRQSAKVTDRKLEVDPENRLLARGPRFRVDAETLRDIALGASGLLNLKMGGPSVKPPQPDGLWFAVGYSDSNTVRFKKDAGNEKVHRRSLYTFWKRTSPPPQMSIADAPSRESCVARRERTNTPMLALMLMNDPQYVEAARYLGQLTLDQNSQSDTRRIEFVFMRSLQRKPTKLESDLILRLLQSNREEFKRNLEAAKKLVAIGEKPADKKYDPAELASWTMIANVLLNMDEFISKN